MEINISKLMFIEYQSKEIEQIRESWHNIKISVQAEVDMTDAWGCCEGEDCETTQQANKPMLIVIDAINKVIKKPFNCSNIA